MTPKQRWRGWVMGRADSIETRGLEQLHPALFGPVIAGRPQKAVVVMHTAPAQLQRLTVEPEALLRIHRDGTDPEGGLLRVDHFVAHHHFAHQRIQVGVIHRPEPWAGHSQLLPHDLL